jgi:gliding motility-associated-like protein
VNPLPNITISLPQDSICFGTTVDLTAAGGTSYLWSADPTITTATNQAQITVAPVGSVTYTVVGSDAIGCQNTATQTVFAATTLSVNEAVTTNICFGSCAGAIDLTPSGSVANYSVVWTDPALAGMSVASLCPNTYDYTVTDAIGCTFSNSINIVEQADNPMDAAIITQPTCFGDSNGSIEIQDAAAVSFNVYSQTALAYLGSQTNGVFNNIGAGTYNLYFTDANGCTYDSLNVSISEISAQINLTVDPQPGPWCFGQNVPFTASASGGFGNLVLNWYSCNDVATCFEGTGSPFNYPIMQDMWFYAQISDDAGCVGDLDSVFVDMSDAIQLSIQNGADLVEICDGECVNMNAAVSGGNPGLTVQWYEVPTAVGGTTIGPNGLTNSICPNATTAVYVYASDGCNAPAYDTLNITVFQVPVVTFTTDVNEGCYPVTVTFTNTTDPTLVGNCIWTTDDGTIIPQCGTQVYTYDTPGSYTPSLFVVSPDGCQATGTSPTSIEVYDYPTAEFTYSPNPVTVLENEVSFSNLTTGATTYDWSFATLGASTEINPTFVFPDIDLATYPVCLIATTEHGCTDTVCYDIFIESIFQAFVPNAFTPDADGKNEVFLPIIQGGNPNNYHLWIYDRWGTLIFETTTLGEAWIGNVRGGDYYPKTDSFVWRIEVEHLADRKMEVMEGIVTLLR